MISSFLIKNYWIITNLFLKIAKTYNNYLFSGFNNIYPLKIIIEINSIYFILKGVYFDIINK